MADSLFIPGRSRPQANPTSQPIAPEHARIAMFALQLTRSIGTCDPYFCDGSDAGQYHCFFCGELKDAPHLPNCGHLVAKRLVDAGSLDDGS
jgi:hypothetical protein